MICIFSPPMWMLKQSSCKTRQPKGESYTTGDHLELQSRFCWEKIKDIRRDFPPPSFSSGTAAMQAITAARTGQFCKMTRVPHCLLDCWCLLWSKVSLNTWWLAISWRIIHHTQYYYLWEKAIASTGQIWGNIGRERIAFAASHIRDRMWNRCKCGGLCMHKAKDYGVGCRSDMPFGWIWFKGQSQRIAQEGFAKCIVTVYLQTQVRAIPYLLKQRLKSVKVVLYLLGWQRVTPYIGFLHSAVKEEKKKRKERRKWLGQTKERKEAGWLFPKSLHL